MSIVNTFKDLFYSTYNGQNLGRDFEILLSIYFPLNSKQSKITAYRKLSPLLNINISYQACKDVNDKFKKTLTRTRGNNNGHQKLAIFKTELGQIYSDIEKFGNFISLITLQNNLEESRSLAGIFILGTFVGVLPENVKIVSLNNSGYIVPNHITNRQLKVSVSVAKKQATHYGSVFPYHRLITMPEWEFIPSEHRKRFARELLCDIDGFFEMDDGGIFGFSNMPRDRIRSRLIKIYSVYKEVPAETLVKALQRSLKKRVADKNILEECADVFDEYCFRFGYCLKKENYLLLASPTLQALIEQESFKDEGSMDAIEKKLVSVLRKNGAPMDTRNFVPLMPKNHASKSHLMEFALLIRREGWRNNSVYHTLDDRYGDKGPDSQKSQGVDRKRVEINRINRDSQLSRKIRRLCKNKCQICGLRIQIGEDSYYSEIHHVQPLGQPHNGDDKQENMLCVCPNDHVKLDYGVIPLETSKLLFLEVNPIADAYIDYHNKFIFRRRE